MRKSAAVAVLSSVVVSLLSACNSLDKPGVEGNSKLVIPVDARPVSQALNAPPAISGGTLAISPEGQQAVAADPDRDRISIVDLRTQQVRHIALEQGDEPGRVVVENASRAYVALRGAGAVVTIDLVNAAIVARTAVCAAPRGMALAKPQLAAASPGVTASNQWLHVACAEGRLVTLNTTGDHSVVRDLKFDADLRDVMLADKGLQVSTFKTAELLVLDEAGALVSRTAPPEFSVSVSANDKNDPFLTRERPMQPHLAWRSVRASTGEVMMLHQASAHEEIDITKRADSVSEQSTPYGGGGVATNCQSVVLATLSTFGAKGPDTSLALDRNVLDVDMAVAPDGSEVAIVEAGTADEQAPRPRVVHSHDGEEDGSGFSVAPPSAPAAFESVPSDVPSESRVFRVQMAGGSPGVNVVDIKPTNGGSFAGCGVGGEAIRVPGQATAVAYANGQTMVVQSREPALLTVISKTTPGAVVALGGESVRDTGHEIFHRNSGGSIACASCHGEGAEDGHVWNFTGQGLRRTQALHVGLQGTAPFHWAGDESDIGALMEDVFVGRMGGVHQSDPRIDSLSRFLFGLEPPQAAVSAEDPAAQRGEALFHSSAVGCSGCHTGAKLTDNHSYDVGTAQGERLQVPSLHGVAYRAPFLHTGCAKTLRDRFSPDCGGSKHGNVAQLQPTEIDDLVAYLRTL